MGRQPCCDERQGLKKGPWSAEEDKKLVSFISTHGHGCWREVPKLAGLLRCGKSCRLRWINYLRPDLKRGMLSMEEENLIIHLHASYGNKWSRIAAQLPGRTDNEIKNCWNTRIKKKLKDMGIDPVTHRPLSEVTRVNGPSRSTGVNGPPAWIQCTDVNGPPNLGHSPIVPFNAYIMANRMQHEGFIGASPDSVMSPQVATTSLSRTPPTTKCEDEHSIDYSAESVSHDRSIDSNVNELRNEEGFQGDPHMMFTRELGRNDGLHNAPHMHNSALGMHNPPHILHNAPHNSPYIIHNSSHIPPHMLRMSHLQASHAAHPNMPLVVPAFQIQALHASSPEGKMDDTWIQSSSSIVNHEDDGCINEGNEVEASAIKEVDECMLALNYMKNVSPYVSPWMIKYIQEGGVQQASQYELKDEEEGTSTSFSTTQATISFSTTQAGGGQWSNMMSDVFLSAEAETAAEAEPQVMSPLLYETSQALGQHMGQIWSNMDCLWF